MDAKVERSIICLKDALYWEALKAKSKADQVEFLQGVTFALKKLADLWDLQEIVEGSRE